MHRPYIRTVRVSLVMPAVLVSLVATGLPLGSGAVAAVVDCDDISFPIEASDLLELELPADCYWVGKMIVDRGVGARVPPPGTGVYTQKHGKRKRAKDFSIETREDGALQLAYVGDVVGAELLEEPLPPPIPGLPEDPDLGLDLPRLAREPCSGCPPPCQDGSNYVVGYKEFGSFDWRIRRKSIPRRLGKRRTMRTIKRAFRSVKRAFNDCDLSEALSTQGAFKGRTGRRANINRDGNCLNSDGRNVVDFGPLAGGGLTCTWYRSRSGYNEHLESDVRLSRSERWTHHPGSNCFNRLDIRSLVTHEIGHVFGLGHVGDGSKNLTMTARIPACTRSHRTLGLGDVRGLRTLY